MSSNISALKPLRFLLAGSHLIEASAGTGKTFTIAALYVRLVLGHGGEHAFARPLTPPEILVVTFTDAATQELRDRIRARLAEAAAYFRVDPASVQPLPPDQDFLHDLRADYPPEQWLSCAHKLQLAAESMDEAAVSTIHGWCNRMLREHAFDSLSLFTQNLETDQSELLSECVRDYWRNHFYLLKEEDARTVLTLWQSPAKLEQSIKDLLAHVQHLPAAEEPDQQLQAWRQDKQASLSELKKPWSQWTQELKKLLDDAVEAGHVNRRRVQARWYDPWLKALNDWAGSDQESLELDTGWERLTPKGMDDVWMVKNQPSPKHPALTALSNLKSALAQLPKPDAGLLRHATHWIAENFDQVQKRRAQMGFDDLLTGLQAALNNAQDEQGARLAALIRRQFPVALIDEFQDTDPIQYDIFQRIYPLEEPHKDCSLILIGDPKQAIYAFRGADIYTYLQAREAVQDRLFTLDTNYRSTADMVEAVNHCFEVCEQNANQPGAFRFRDDQDNPVPFFPVTAHGRVAQFQIEGQTQAALQLLVLDDGEALTKGNYLTNMAALAVSRIVALLNLGQRQQAGFVEEGTLQPVQPNDIAVLVNNVTEATHIRQALSRRGVRSVYLSDKESVYASPQALEVYRWLLACSEPDNDSLLRAALSTACLGLTFAELDELNRDELVWEARVIQFKAYQRQWQTQGVLPMVRRLLFDFDVVDRLQQTGVNADGSSGERLLTDLLHLSELLQQASHALEGEHALIRYLAEQMAAPAQDSDAHKVRLESDADLVKVVTIHKSKGLEYPLVFLPFICAARPAKAQDTPIVWHDDQGQLQVELEADETIVIRADEERLAEDLRKLYVALTRARYGTWMGLAPLKDESASSITYLLGLKDVAPGAWGEYLEEFAKTQSAIHVVMNPTADEMKFTPRSVVQSQLAALQLHRPVKEDWRIGSYSQLAHSVQSHESASMLEDSAKTENLQEALGEDMTQTVLEKRPQGSLHRFPKGAEAGTFLHDLLEWAAQQGFADVAADPAPLRDVIALRCHGRGWEIWVNELQTWVLRLLQMPLRLPDVASPVRLQDLSRYQAEMEFWFAAHHTDLQRLDKLVTQHTLGGRPRPPIQSSALNGLLKGFMDLVFEHDGCYYVADYKSNWLGPDESHYTVEQLDEAIRSHRYDLQYVLYLLALHRHLRTRLSDYDYDHHVGGAVYWFLRGIEHESCGLHIEKPPKVLIEALDALFSGRDRRAA